MDILLDYARLVGGRSQATVVGRGVRTSAPLAALVNGQAAHVLDFDDTYASSETTLHGTPPVYSAALAVGEWQRASGAAVLQAFVLGFEVAARVALALGPEHYDAGWHVTGTAGRFGATAAAGKLLGLSETALARAFGIVATQRGDEGRVRHDGQAAARGAGGARRRGRGAARARASRPPRMSSRRALAFWSCTRVAPSPSGSISPTARRPRCWPMVSSRTLAAP